MSAIKQDEYFKFIQKSYSSDIKISNLTFDSLKNTEYAVTIKYDLNLNLNDEDIIYLNPLFGEAIKENPFKSGTRLFPVEMPYCIDETYVINMEMPKGYSIDEMPKSARITLNEDQGMFEYIIGKIDQYQIHRHSAGTA